MSVEISNWKEFRVGDLFDIHPTKTIEGVNAEMCNGGKTPLVVNQSYNNGVAGMCNFEPTEKGGIITFSDTWEGNTFFYQPEDFIGFAHVQGMYPKQYITPKCMLFLCTMLDFDARGRYSYGRKKRRDIIAEVRLKLPADNEGNPDWEAMESYIDSLHHKPLTTKNKRNNIPKLKIDDWKEFRINDLFTVELSKGDIKEDDVETGNVPLVSSGENNNGIVKHIIPEGDGKAVMFDGNKITIDMFGNAFYQREPFYAVSHGRVNILSPKFLLNQYIGLFIISIIKKEQFKYSYGRAVYSNVAGNMIIKIPVTVNGDPDWNFMENYIKNLSYGDRLKG